MTIPEINKWIAGNISLPHSITSRFNIPENPEVNRSIRIKMSSELKIIADNISIDAFTKSTVRGQEIQQPQRLIRLKHYKFPVKRAYVDKFNYNCFNIIKEGDGVKISAISIKEVKKAILNFTIDYIRQAPQYQWVLKGEEHKKSQEEENLILRRATNYALNTVTNYVVSGTHIPNVSIIVPVSKMLTMFFDKALPTESQFFNEIVETSMRDLTKEVLENIKEVKGEMIRYYYDKRSYSKITGSLGSSCMNYTNIKHRFDLYVKNPDKVSLLVLLDREKKLEARAILWTTDSGERLIERIFSCSEESYMKMTTYANTKKFKSTSNINRGIPLVNTQIKVTLDTSSLSSNPPYLDSLCKDPDVNKNDHIGVFKINRFLGPIEDPKDKINTVKVLEDCKWTYRNTYWRVQLTNEEFKAAEYKGIPIKHLLDKLNSNNFEFYSGIKELDSIVNISDLLELNFSTTSEDDSIVYLVDKDISTGTNMLKLSPAHIDALANEKNYKRISTDRIKIKGFGEIAKHHAKQIIIFGKKKWAPRYVDSLKDLQATITLLKNKEIKKEIKLTDLLWVKGVHSTIESLILFLGNTDVKLRLINSISPKHGKGALTIKITLANGQAYNWVPFVYSDNTSRIDAANLINKLLGKSHTSIKFRSEKSIEPIITTPLDIAA